jgi:hypothetical protein
LRSSTASQADDASRSFALIEPRLNIGEPIAAIAPELEMRDRPGSRRLTNPRDGHGQGLGDLFGFEQAIAHSSATPGASAATTHACSASRWACERVPVAAGRVGSPNRTPNVRRDSHALKGED